MFSTLRTRFGIPGVISVIALVFAMLGGAYAASNDSGAKATASKAGKRGPRGPKGATGPAGPQGPAGANGKDGANGSDGQSVAITALGPGQEGCATGGAKFSVGASSAHVCNGTNGTDGTPGESVTISAASAGECATGGAKFSVGASSGHVCNGAQGPPGTDGAPGTNGNTILSGSGAPSNANGANGDFYIDISTFTIYGPKSGGAWGSGTALAGGGGGGTITSVTVSGGLTGGGTSGTVNVGVDPTQIQSRVSGTCGAGEAIRTIAQNGTVVCETTGGGGGGGLPTVLTGVWSVAGEPTTVPRQVSISFLATVEPAPTLAYVFPGATSGLLVDTENNKTLTNLESKAAIEAHCATGTFADPSAKPGNVCVFAEAQQETHLADLFPLAFEEHPASWKDPDPNSGVVVPFAFEGTEGGYAKGSWAVNTE